LGYSSTIFGEIAATVATIGVVGWIGYEAVNDAIQYFSTGKDSKEPGSYTNTHESGKKYHGKGPQERAEQSAKEKAEKYNDPVKDIDWTPSKNDREAFKDEYSRLKDDGGPKNPDNYNQIESPGKKYTEQDAKKS
jgi:hypothetical protein